MYESEDYVVFDGFEDDGPDFDCELFFDVDDDVDDCFGLEEC